MRIFGLAVIASLASVSIGQSYKFKIDPERTFTQGSLQIQMELSGRFIGDYDAKSNPNGSRTKAGVAGAFGPNQNEPVLAKAFWSMTDSTDLHTGGSFDLDIDLAKQRASVSNYTAERLAAGPLGLATRYELDSELFMTESPAAAWQGDSSPSGSGLFQLAGMKLTQREGAREGSLTPLGDGWYRVSINFMAEVTLDVLDFEQSGPVVFPVASSLVGNFKVTADGPVFTYPKGKGGDNFTRNVHLPLEDFTFDISAGPEKKARLRYESTLDKVSLRVNGIRQFLARGTAVSR